ncbi:MAG TPA: gephyrin-like molybdotransferase Glp [Thermoanaerobaculia bacterium]
MISVERALEIIASATAAGATEPIPVSDVSNRVLARQVEADVDWPPFDTSAMDGFAVRLADVTTPGVSLPERAAAVTAGDPPPAPLAKAEAVRVMTGAVLPEGAEAVIPVEESRRQAGSVSFRVVPLAGAHIRRRGESIASGSTLLRAGRRLSPADVALAAFAGVDPCIVYRRPSIAIAATGNELVPSSARPGPGQLRDSNGPMLLALCRARGWPARLIPRVPDEPAAVEALFDSGADRPQVLLTSGGVSAGELDLLPEIARQRGFDLLFHGVAIGPGKPIAFGRRSGSFWFGLPGNPVSSAVGFHVFVRTALDRLEGAQNPGAPRFFARLARALRASESRELYRDGIAQPRRGEMFVEPLTSRGSHDLATHAQADALIRLPVGSGVIEEGAVVECLDIRT